MPAKEVLQFYGLDSFWGKIWYAIKFLWRFFLDKLIFIDDGRVKAVGSHDELMETCPAYAHMVELQRLEEAANA